MRIPLEWLAEHLDARMPPAALAATLTAIGHETELADGETVLDVTLTPNRGDCGGAAGLARDLAAAGAGTLIEQSVPSINDQEDPALAAAVDPDSGCRQFALRRIENVTNPPAPDWMRQRLQAAGCSTISALVDITNYVARGWNRPLHAFDADKVVGKLTVRNSRAGETVTALNGQAYELPEGVAVIADEAGIESVGAVIGGLRTACTAATKNILLESAAWDPAKVLRDGRKLKINTDARWRYERGTDPEFVRPGLDLATQLVLDVCGGSPAGFAAVGDVPPRAELDFDFADIARLIGCEAVAPEPLTAKFKMAGIEPVGDGRTRWRIPSWRHDLDCRAALAGEAVRLLGFDRLVGRPAARPPAEAAGARTAFHSAHGLRRKTARLGYREAITYSFIAEKQAQLFGGGDESLRLRNPLSPKTAVMRPSLLPGLLAAGDWNCKRGRAGAALFEIGTVFDNGGGERTMLAGLRMGGTARSWDGSAKPADFRAAQADLLSLLDIGPERRRIMPADAAWLHPGKAGAVQVDGEIIGRFGEPHPDILRELGINRPAAVFEAVIGEWPAPDAKRPPDLSKLHPVRRDFAFIVDKAVPAGDVLRAVRQSDPRVIETAVFDVYDRGAEKSLGIEAALQPADEPLTAAQIEAWCAAAAALVRQRTGGRLAD